MTVEAIELKRVGYDLKPFTYSKSYDDDIYLIVVGIEIKFDSAKSKLNFIRHLEGLNTLNITLRATTNSKTQGVILNMHLLPELLTFLGRGINKPKGTFELMQLRLGSYFKPKKHITFTSKLSKEEKHILSRVSHLLV